jgi:hypothetical protein
VNSRWMRSPNVEGSSAIGLCPKPNTVRGTFPIVIGTIYIKLYSRDRLSSILLFDTSGGNSLILFLLAESDLRPTVNNSTGSAVSRLQSRISLSSCL